MNISELKSKIIDKSFKESINYFKEINSTNTYCKENFHILTDKTLIIAEKQTNGKGKNNRNWHSPKGGLYFSILLKNKNLSLENSSLLPLLTSVAIFNSLKEFNIKSSIKWPNDILIDKKKLSGILVESKISSKGFSYIVIGVGINVNSLLSSNEKDLNLIFTSLKEKFNKDFSLETLLASIINNFSLLFDELTNFGFKKILSIYKENCYLINKEVTLFNNNEEKLVKVLDINEVGALKVSYDDKIEFIKSGEFSISKNSL